MGDDIQRALRRLENDGLVEQADGALRTTRKWQGAMARAALQLMEAGDSGDDLRVPIVRALIEIYGTDTTDDELTTLTAAMLPIEARSLGMRPSTNEPS